MSSESNNVPNDEVALLFQQIRNDKRIEVAAALTPAQNDTTAGTIKTYGEKFLKLKEQLEKPEAKDFIFQEQTMEREKFITMVKNDYKNFNIEVDAALHVNLGPAPNGNTTPNSGKSSPQLDISESGSLPPFTFTVGPDNGNPLTFKQQPTPPNTPTFTKGIPPTPPPKKPTDTTKKGNAVIGKPELRAKNMERNPSVPQLTEEQRELLSLKNRLKQFEDAFEKFKKDNNIDLKRELAEHDAMQAKVESTSGSERKPFENKRDAAFQKHAIDENKLMKFKADIKDENGKVVETMSEAQAYQIRERIAALSTPTPSNNAKNKYEGLSIKDLSEKLAIAKDELGRLREREKSILYHIEKFEKDNKVEEKGTRIKEIDGALTKLEEQKPPESDPPFVKNKHAQEVKKLEDEKKLLAEGLEKNKVDLSKLKGLLTDHTGKKEEVIIVDEQKKVEKFISEKKAEVEALQDAMNNSKEDKRKPPLNVAQNKNEEKVNFLNNKAHLEETAAKHGCSCSTSAGICKMVSKENPKDAVTVNETGVSTPPNSSKEALELQAKIFIELRLKNNLPIEIEHVNIKGPNASALTEIYEKQVKALKQQQQTTINPADSIPEKDKQQTLTNISGQIGNNTRTNEETTYRPK